MQSEVPPKPSRFQKAFMVAFRTLFVTLLCAMGGMALGLFCGIVGTAILNAVRHGGVDMSNAYRHVAIPVAILAGSCAFLFQVVTGIRTSLRPRNSH
jgi:hypothetical protein